VISPRVAEQSKPAPELVAIGSLDIEQRTTVTAIQHQRVEHEARTVAAHHREGEDLVRTVEDSHCP